MLIIYLQSSGGGTLLASSAADPGTSPPPSPEGPPLLGGETIQDKAHDVTYLCPYRGPTRGYLCITNYKLYFRSTDRDNAYILEVPLGVVSFVKVNILHFPSKTLRCECTNTNAKYNDIILFL